MLCATTFSQRFKQLEQLGSDSNCFGIEGPLEQLGSDSNCFGIEARLSRPPWGLIFLVFRSKNGPQAVRL
jgi:hypothetical protein